MQVDKVHIWPLVDRGGRSESSDPAMCECGIFKRLFKELHQWFLELGAGQHGVHRWTICQGTDVSTKNPLYSPHPKFSAPCIRMDPFSNELAPSLESRNPHSFCSLRAQIQGLIFMQIDSLFCISSWYFLWALLIKANIIQCRRLTSHTLAQKYRDFGRVKSRLRAALRRRQAACGVLSVPHISRDINEFLETSRTPQRWRNKATLGLYLFRCVLTSGFSPPCEQLSSLSCHPSIKRKLDKLELSVCSGSPQNWGCAANCHHEVCRDRRIQRVMAKTGSPGAAAAETGTGSSS